MKIAIIKPTETVSPTGGVKIQAEMWKRGLEALGNEVTLINLWTDNYWQSYDIILFIQFGGILKGMVKALSQINTNLVIAPIIDTNFSLLKFKIICKYYGSDRLKISNIFHDFYQVRDLFKMYYVRSEYEKQYVLRGLNIKEDKIKIIPLSYRLTPPHNIPPKEDFCFHASLLADKRKNVERLIRAAQKYKFTLILAGNIRNSTEKKWLDNLLYGYSNISYLGRISDTELFDCFSRAKVFALPSINEGVGMVALEAATYGCEIVLTKLGAPKEYYNGMAHLIDPYNIDSIGNTIINAMEHKYFQPKLREYIIPEYNLIKCCKLLDHNMRKISLENI